jgi:hypothetical protein
MANFGIFRGFNEKLFEGETPTNLGLIGSDEYGYDVNYKAILDYATTQGYTLPSASQQIIQNQLVLDLKNGGIWNKLDSFAVFATDGDSDFALIDWKRLTQYTAYNSPTFTANEGFQGNGSSAYIDSNFNPFTNGTNYTINSASIGGYMRLYDTSPGGLEGFVYLDDGSSRAWMRYTTNRLYMNNLSFSLHASTFAGNNKFSSFVRTSSTNVGIYVDGSLSENVANTSLSVPNNTFLTLKGDGANYGDSQMSMIYVGGDLSSEQNDFYTAFYTNYLLNI